MYGGIWLNWLVNVLIIAGLVLLVVWLVRKIENEDKRRRKYK